MEKHENKKVHVSHILLFLLLVAVSFITAFPIIYSLSGAFKENMELLSSGKFLPEKITFSNYIYAWENVKFFRNAFNSLIVSGATVAFALIISSMAGYALTRKKFPGSGIINTVYLWSMFLSLGSATLYPVYQLCIDLKLNSTLIGLVFVSVGAQVYNIILVKGYIMGVPKEYDEAASIDGCGFFTIYLKVILPLIRPVLGVIALFAFVGAWNSYLMPMILTAGNPAIKTLAVGIVEMKTNGEMATLWSVILAGANISIVPIIIVYICANKQFISGLTLGGLKG